jgi:PKD repeat protein
MGFYHKITFIYPWFCNLFHFGRFASQTHIYIPWVVNGFPLATEGIPIKDSRLWLRLIVVFLGMFLSTIPASGQNCTDGTTTINMDLSASADATWQTSGPVTPDGQCCGAPSNQRCMEFIVTLHPDANGISIAFTNSIGSVYYTVNCGPAQYTDSNLINICFGEGDPGPHSISFCRNGTPSYEFTVYSIKNDLNVTLDPFDPVCENSSGFLLTGGKPIGGTYFVNGNISPFFNVAHLGPGDHEVTYKYTDLSTGCMAFDTEIITIVPMPSISWTTEEFCMNEGWLALGGASPPGGVYSGNLVSAGNFDTDAAIPGTYEIQYTYTNVYGCTSSDTGFVVVNELPLADAGSDQTVISGNSTILSAQNGGPESYSYSWEPAHLLVNPNVQNPTTVNLFNSTQFTLTVTNTASGCISTDKVLVNITGGEIHISELVGLPDAICQGDSSQLWVLPGGGSGNFTYHWTANPPDTPDFPSSQATPMASPLQTTTYTVEVRDASIAGATPATASVVVTVNPLPVVTLNMQPTVCANTPSFSLSGGSPAGGTYYLLDHLGNLLDLPYIDFSNFVPNDIGEGDYQVMYEFTNPVSGCTNYAFQPLTILPYVDAQFYTSRDDICLSNEVNIANHSVGAIDYEWSYGDGVTDTEGAPAFLHSYPLVPDIEDYTITLTASNAEGCSDTRQRSVKVYPPVTADFTASDTHGCSDLTVDFTSHSEGPILYHFWDFGDGTFSIEENPTKTYTNNSNADTTFLVTLSIMSVNYFCTSTHTIPITVYPAIESGFGMAPIAGCHPLDVEISNMATGATDYEWDFGNGTTSTDEDPGIITFTNSTDTIVRYTITQKATNEHCSSISTQELEVYPEIMAGFNISTSGVCSPVEVVFTNNSTVTARHFEWDFGDGATSSERDPVYTFENNTDAPITYTVWLRARTDNFCRDSAFVEITVNPYLEADFDFNPAQVCNPEEITIFNKAYGATSYEWNMGDGTIYHYGADSLQFQHLYEHDDAAPVVYNITLTITNDQGCIDTLMRPITVFPKIHAEFTPTVDMGCSPLEVTFNNTSTGVLHHQWEFGDGSSSNQATVSHTFTNTSFVNDTVFDVWLFTESEFLCRDSVNQTITLYPAVKAAFTVEENQGCSPFIVTIDNKSKGAATQSWEYGDGDTSSDTGGILTHIYENKTDQVLDFPLKLTATNSDGCWDTLERIITVYPEVNIAYSHPEQGCHPLAFPVENTTENANYFDWNFGDGIVTDQANPEHVFHNFDHFTPVSYNIHLFASSVYGCFADSTSQVEIFPKPNSSFSIMNSPGCSPYEIVIEHNSAGATDYMWDFDDGIGILHYDSVIVTHAYNVDPGSGPGYFNINLITENSFACQDTLEQQAIVYPNIRAEFEADVVEGCHPLTVEFTNRSYGATAEAPYFWNYGNGNSSQNLNEKHTHTFHNFSHTQDTIYQVVLTAYNQNNCLHKDTVYIRVLPQPKAYFTVPNTPGCAPYDIIIQNLAEGADQLTWDMGDGDTLYTHDASFTHLYHQPADQGPGTYTIKLTTENNHHCRTSHSQQVVIYPEIIPELTTDTEGCHPHTAVFENTSQGGEIFSWNFGNGNTSQAAQPQQTFTNYSHTESKVYQVNLLVESSWGCEAQVNKEITVRPIPEPLFELTPFTGCAPFTPQISNLSVGANAFEWNLGDTITETADSTFYYTWNNKGTIPLHIPISLTATNEFGCEAIKMQTTSVFPEVTAGFTTEDNTWEGCSPLTLKFANNSHLAETYKWDFGDENVSNSATPLHVFVNDEIDTRIYPVEMIATSIYGCKDTLSREVKVFPSPAARFSAQPESQPYPNTTVTFTNTTNQGYWNFTWHYGDENSTETTLFDPVTHSYVWDENDMSTKEYVVALIAENEHCSDLYTQVVTITSPVPKADITSVKSGCAPFKVQFSNQSMYAHSFRWNFDDGGTSTDPAPEHTFMDHGLYNVYMVAVGDGGRDTIYHQVEVLENPVASFELVAPHINIPEEPLQVVNHSSLADFYFWDFGDGNTSYDFEPEYYYTESGVYDIMLVATSNTQPLCHDTLVLHNSLRVDESCKIIFPDAFIPDQAGPSGGNFDINNPSTSVFHPVYEGVDEYSLEIYTRWGELIYRSDDINIGWDGYHKGRLSQMDVYVWKATGRCTNGRSFTLTGDVTLYR